MKDFDIQIRKSNSEWKLPEEEFKRRYRSLFYDPYFDPHRDQVNNFADIAYKAYLEGRKAPKTQKAGSRYADPNYDLSVEWVAAKEEINKAQKVHDDVNGPRRILLISASHRDDHTCPGEISKSSRLFDIAKKKLIKDGMEVEILELDKITSEYGKTIYPCKACVSTAMPLCHWPCSCYPNHSLGQVQDWMNEIYPKWVRAHGIMIISPVYWHQSPSALKLMLDRLVCADGGNPDPTTTQGKKAALAKKIELAGWKFPRHLKGRVFSVVVHGDTVGADDTKSAICDVLSEMELISSGNYGNIARYIGYYKPYATSHDDLDIDEAIQKEVMIAAHTLVENVKAQHQQKLTSLIPVVDDPRPK
jgi:multimeric flavodoxin WrbA